MAVHHSPLVSVIMIFLNGEEFIQEAIASVFAQTYENWELLLVDDGSTDNSTAIARQYAQQHPDQVRYLEHDQHQNLGTGRSRNYGVEQAQGQYITFLDADDVWLPHKLEQQVALMQAHPEAAMAYGRIQCWYSWTGKPEDQQRDWFFELGVLPDTLIQPPQLLINLLSNRYQEPYPSNVMIRSEVFTQLGCFDEQFRSYGEDKTFFTKVELHAPVFVSGQQWIKYRRHSQSCCYVTEKDKSLFKAKIQDFYAWLERYLITQSQQDTEVWEVFQAAKRRFNYRYSALYFIWKTVLDRVMVQSRRFLPNALRHWLWLHFGSKIYG